MRKNVLLLIVIFSSYVNANETKSHEGYCVTYGDQLKLKNAVVLVKDGAINNMHLGASTDNDFFDFKNGQDSLEALGLFNYVRLIKLKGSIEGKKNIAVLNKPFSKPLVVECSYSDGVLGGLCQVNSDCPMTQECKRVNRATYNLCVDKG